MQASGTHVDLYLFGVIGDWWDGNTVNNVLYQLQTAKNVETITVKLSTVGGYFEDGLPIYNLLKQHSAHVTIEVIGYSLSMGSVIMLAGDTIRMAQNALVMIHNAQGLAYGSQHDMRKAADMLAKHEAAILPRYMERMSKTGADVQALLDAETWFTADEALAAGLVDEIIDPVDLSQIDKQQPENAWDFATKNFKHPPSNFVERVEHAAHKKQSWVLNLLSRVVGQPAAPIPRPDPSEVETEMTLEEMQAALKEEREATARMIDEKFAGLKLAEKTADPTPEPTPAPSAESPEMTALKAEIAALKEKLAKLEVPGTVPPLVTGPAGKSNPCDGL